MARLTDRRTAQQVKENAAGLMAAGFRPSVSDLMYIKLAEYENAAEECSILFVCDPAINTPCTKENCIINGGECSLTRDIEYRRGNDEHRNNVFK